MGFHENFTLPLHNAHWLCGVQSMNCNVRSLFSEWISMLRQEHSNKMWIECVNWGLEWMVWSGEASITKRSTTTTPAAAAIALCTRQMEMCRTVWSAVYAHVHEKHRSRQKTNNFIHIEPYPYPFRYMHIHICMYTYVYIGRALSEARKKCTFVI